MTSDDELCKLRHKNDMRGFSKSFGGFRDPPLDVRDRVYLIVVYVKDIYERKTGRWPVSESMHM